MITEYLDGVISGVTDWGIYVEIIENKCEGMVRMRDMKHDHFILTSPHFLQRCRTANGPHHINWEMQCL